VKLVALALALAAVGCSVNHRSGEFTCQTTADCASDRTCTDGLCVLIDPPTDGGLPGGACPANCTSCDASTHTCTIECVNNDVCKQTIVCAQGWNCAIDCTDAGSCRAGIDCRDAASCNVNCDGDTSCRNATCGGGNCTFTCNGTGSCSGIACGTGACNVACNGNNSCHDANGGGGLGVNCSNACACDVTCGFNATCAPVVCPAGCDDIIDGCTSQRATCNTCPAP
jgi:hypothetical protein